MSPAGSPRSIRLDWYLIISYRESIHDWGRLAYKDSDVLCDGINDVCLSELPGEATEEDVGEIFI
jgi:hypothetical protein